MDYNALRAQTMGSGFDEEAVTVNTRALIDKVLARYSGEWTVLRELLQNAADATATKVTVKFETIPSAAVPLPQEQSPSNILKHTVQHHTLKRLVVSNNGQVFNEKDWSRLKRIAEGNPDETKIGAFGVGFYSVFADCEEPFVSSGREAMAFFWKNNSLFTRRLRLPEKDASSDTTFVLDYRDTTSPVPPLLPLAQFLSSSLTFVGLENIDFFIDDHNILSLQKKASPNLDVAIPRDIEPKTSEGFMKVTAVTKQVAQIDGSWMKIVGWTAPKTSTSRTNERDSGPSLRKFFSRLAGAAPEEQVRPPSASGEDNQNDGLATKVSATVFLNVNTATIKTFTGQKFNEELERATKKPPPKYTKLAILTAPYIENDTVAKTKSAGDIFGSVLPSRSGKIFIGFPTHQTTGLNAHISAPSVIPTVERESIDLNARYVRTWNIEMLRAAGIVCRIAWSAEMSELGNKIARHAQGQRKVKMDNVQPYLPEATTMFKNFTFRESTPASKTGQILEDAFWTCGKKASIEVLSSCGVLQTHDVRMAPKDLSFMDGIPILPEALVKEAKSFIDKLIDFGLITEVTVSDVKKSLESTPLTATQVSEFLSWLTKQATKGQLDKATVESLLSVAIANDESSEGIPSQVLVLGDMQHFLNASKISVDLPIPPTVMPFKFTKSMSKHELESIGWQELQIVPWIRWLIQVSKDRNILSEEKDLTGSKAFASQILPLLSKQWDSLSQSSKSSLLETLAIQTVIPTKLGMRKPAESYFPNVKLFDDLPTIVSLGAVKDKFLVALGVRKTIELGVVFDRLLALDGRTKKDEKPQWSHIDLIQYLASVRDDIPGQDIQRLRNTPICPRSIKCEEIQDSKRYKVSELFEPRAELRDLGLPVLQWQGPFRGGSPEGRLLSALGLRTSPTAEELINTMARAGATRDLELRDKALIYFLSHHHADGYARFNYAGVQVPFLPLERQPEELATPSQCYVDEGAALLGYDVLKRDWVPHASKLGVAIHPPMADCITILAKRPPTTHQEARAVFGYFAGRLSEIDGSTIPRLRTLPFVPIFSRDKQKTLATRHATPQSCFLGESETFGGIFDFVDFGNAANSFLIRCGSKLEPTKPEVAQILVREPARISSTFRSPEKYLALLRNMADSVAELKKNKDLWREMKKSPFLLASKELPAQQSKAQQTVTRADDLDDLEDDEAQGIREFQLCKAEDAIIVDDYINYSLFKASVLAAPQEETLEDFYFALGSPVLSSLVEEAARHGPRAPDQKPALRLQKQILERSRLFLHDQPPDSIKHDTKWLEKNLNVQLVSSISLRRSLKGRNVTHTEKRTAVVTQVNREYTLWVSGERPDLYQVSQALVNLLLNRPKPHSALTLEMLLKTDLLDLRARGFNVSRILRQKAAEARLAESKRQQELEEESRRIEEQQKAWDAAHEQVATRGSKQGAPPGGFPDSPDGKDSRALPDRSVLPTDDSDDRHGPRNLLSNISRQFGLNNNRHIQSMFGRQPDPLPDAVPSAQSDAPPPYSADDTSTKKTQKQAGAGVTAPHQLQQNLLSAIKKARPHTSSQLYSRGETNTVSETKSYCDEHPAHDLTAAAEMKHGITIFLSPTAFPDAVRPAFLTQHSAGLQSFATLLKDVGAVFSLDPKILNIFYETNGKTIAFNRQGSIFCNFFYFEKLHEKLLADGGIGEYGTVFVYWWVILCHELAHNLVGDHSSDHSYYTEGFVSSYFGKVVAWLGEISNKRNSAAVQQQPNNLVD
ncbi:uncharacterized protein HMPREF1541_04536 [Cyphellophora europaea CBS 101466]|uniref:Sacsin/Nov domain-containing protein n=1 Tax=Cyphellophora europaea (strain CBS 101466) TaxID=1220924 RepID=W2RVB9_CYPE1|nr:uncharacterized protein HMPREF1541_04536 [Cyphellophora europaea CBS 101466]ETN40260.1 hypothetical protein HMPREF1541_04536 [Cyphellophora europaea CBS 101466]